MARSLSVPCRGPGNVNPFYSDKVQSELRLQELRPGNLPADGSDGESSFLAPLSGSAAQKNPERLFEPTGKGRGGSATGMLGSLQSTEYGNSRMMSEGEMPRESDSLKTMGLVRNQQKVQQHGSPDGLQRALEGEMVNMLRQQNSKLMDELQFLRAKLEKGSMGKPASGMESSPWSALDGSADSSNGFVGTLPPERHGRHGSRTPRSKIRDAAVRSEKRDSKKYTPNGTRVPDGLPPDSRELLPVPPFPVPPMGGQDGDVSFGSGLYDTCESSQR